MMDTVKTTHFQARINAASGVIRIPQNFTVVEAVAFKQHCQTFFAEYPDIKRLILDFEVTQFVDSSAIGALVICHRLSQVHQVQLSLKNIPEQVMMVLSMTELDKVFEIESASPPPAMPETVANRPTTAKQPLESLPETHPSVRSKTKRLIDILGACVGLVITVFFSNTDCDRNKTGR
jgi:anti-anti-sigma factor